MESQRPPESGGVRESPDLGLSVLATTQTGRLTTQKKTCKLTVLIRLANQDIRTEASACLARRFRANREPLESCQQLPAESQGQNMILTVLNVQFHSTAVEPFSRCRP